MSTQAQAHPAADGARDFDFLMGRWKVHNRVRFTWTCQGRDTARWEQAFSPDGGRTWETNWVMEFSRVDA